MGSIILYIISGKIPKDLQVTGRSDIRKGCCSCGFCSPGFSSTACTNHVICVIALVCGAGIHSLKCWHVWCTFASHLLLRGFCRVCSSSDYITSDYITSDYITSYLAGLVK